MKRQDHTLTANVKRWAMLMAVVFSCYSSGLGCRGSAPDTPEEGLKEAELVFQGKVVAADPNHTTFSIDKIWKGASKNEITLLNNYTCPAFFDVGEKYIVYARRFGGEGLVATRLERNIRLDLAAADLAVLGNPFVVNTKTLSKDRKIVVTSILVVLLILSTLLIYRRMRVRRYD